MSRFSNPKRVRNVDDTLQRSDTADTVEPTEESPDIVADSDKIAEEAEDPVGSSRILAIHVCPDRPGDIQIGAAILDCASGQLCVLGRTVGWEGDFQFLAGLLLDVAEPVSSILISSKSSEAIIEILKHVDAERFQASKEVNEAADLPEGKITLLPSSLFDYQASVKLIASKLNGVSSAGSMIDLLNRASVQATGAVLTHALRLSPDIPPIEFDMFDLGNYLVIDAGSSKALDLTKLEEHPSLVRGRGVPKEGFSLLSLLDRSKSKHGSRTIRRWISRPLTNVVEISQRHDAVEYLVRRHGHEFVSNISRHLAKTGDLHRSLLRLKACTAQPSDWLIIADSLSHIQLALTELAIQEDQMDGDPLPQLLSDIAKANKLPGLFEVSRALSLLDWEQLRANLRGPSPRVVPIDGANNDVDEIRKRYAQLPDLLTAETSALSVEGATIRCIPVIGFVMAVEQSSSIFNNCDNELLFEAVKQGGDGQLLRYFKTDRTKFLDSQLGDIPGILRDIEDGFVRKIEGIVLSHEMDLYTVAIRCAELDGLISFAEVAYDFGYCRPEMTIEPVSSVVGARHPLLERILDESFVPSDLQIDPGCLVIVGPNYSGKSVVLKTMALVHVLAQMGSFVPATRATLGVVDRIFTRITSIETMGSAAFQRESSFSIDVQQIVSMLRCCTPKSLILVDEFGKGTNSWDGSALLAAVIRTLSEGGSGPTPRCVFATHLMEIFDAKLLTEGDANTAEMAVEFENGDPVPLFRLQPCELSSHRESYGVACARRAGVPEQVLDRATELNGRLSKGLSIWRENERNYQEIQHKKSQLIEQFMAKPGDDSSWNDKDVVSFLKVITALEV